HSLYSTEKSRLLFQAERVIKDAAGLNPHELADDGFLLYRSARPESSRDARESLLGSRSVEVRASGAVDFHWELAFGCLSLPDNDGNVGGSLGRDVKTGIIVRQISIKVPANPDVTKLERSGEATAHVREI